MWKAYELEECGKAFRGAFGDEWAALNHDQRMLVVDDFLAAHDEDGVSVPGYAARIGSGNLASYVACLEIPNKTARSK